MKGADPRNRIGREIYKTRELMGAGRDSICCRLTKRDASNVRKLGVSKSMIDHHYLRETLIREQCGNMLLIRIGSKFLRILASSALQPLSQAKYTHPAACK